MQEGSNKETEQEMMESVQMTVYPRIVLPLLVPVQHSDLILGLPPTHVPHDTIGIMHPTKNNII